MLLALNEKREDKIIKLQQKVNENNTNIANCYNTAPEYWDRPTEEAIAARKEHDEKLKEVLELYKKMNEYKTAEAIRKHNSKVKSYKAVGILIVLVFICIFNMLVAVKPEWFIKLSNNSTTLFIFSIITAIIFFIVFKRAIKRYDKNNNPNTMQWKYQTIIDKKNKELNDLEFKARETTRVYNNYRGKVDPYYETKYKRFVNSNKKIEKQIDDINLEFKKVVDEFRKNKYIILENDYQYVDYLIFLFQSKRADNISSALQQLDMERRNVQLLNKLDD